MGGGGDGAKEGRKGAMKMTKKQSINRTALDACIHRRPEDQTLLSLVMNGHFWGEREREGGLAKHGVAQRSAGLCLKILSE